MSEKFRLHNLPGVSGRLLLVICGNLRIPSSVFGIYDANLRENAMKKLASSVDLSG